MDLALLDRADPGAWYMDSQKYAELADAQLVVEGMALPAHSQLLARASPVVLDLLRDQRRGSVRVEGAAAPAEVSEGLFGAPPPPGARPTPAWRRPPPPPCALQATLTLEAPFHDYTVLEVACLLRLVYRPSEESKEGFKAIGARLPGVLRLAHQLEMEGLVASITDFVGSCSNGELSLKQMAEWATLAERLHLDALMARCVRTLAAHMLQHSAQTPFSAVALIVPHLSPTCLGAVLSALVTSCCTLRQHVALAGSLPAAADIARWQQDPNKQPARPFIWKLTGARSKLQGSEDILSEPFMPRGRRWLLVVRPGEQVTVYLVLVDTHRKGPAATRFSLTIRNQVCARALVLNARGPMRTSRLPVTGAQAGKPDKRGVHDTKKLFLRTRNVWGGAEFISRAGKPVYMLGACC